MDTRRIGGENGFDIPIVGLGCNAFGRRLSEDETHPVLHAAIDAGVTFFDTAEGYGNGKSEEFIGNALKGRRDEVILATKFGYNMLHVPGKGKGSPENIAIAIDGSLKRLRTDHVDLYQIHRFDPETPIAETLGAMNELVSAGKVRLIGCSNFSAAQLRDAARTAEEMGIRSFATLQNEWSVLDRTIESDDVPACEELDVGILPYYPLARGLLTGKYRRGEGGPAGSRLEGTLGGVDFDRLEALENFATARGHNLLTLAVSWLASQPATACVISGATRPEQLAQNAAAAGWKMTADELAGIDRILS
jgi:aryl-alcohol dehydrogenase-like predicted oxidoreductase